MIEMMNMIKYPVSSPPHSPRRGEAWQTPRFLQRKRSRNCVQPISPAGGGWEVDIPPSGGLGGLLDAFLRNAFVVEHSFSNVRKIIRRNYNHQRSVVGDRNVFFENRQ